MARFFTNVSDHTLRIPCELVIPAGHTTLPVEHGGIAFTREGERLIAGAADAGILRVSEAPDLEDQMGVGGVGVDHPGHLPGIDNHRAFAIRTGDATVGHILRVTAASIAVTKAGQQVHQHTYTNETSMGTGLSLWALRPLDVGARLHCRGLSDAVFTEGGIGHRLCICSQLNPS